MSFTLKTSIFRGIQSNAYLVFPEAPGPWIFFLGKAWDCLLEVQDNTISMYITKIRLRKVSETGCLFWMTGENGNDQWHLKVRNQKGAIGSSFHSIGVRLPSLLPTTEAAIKTWLSQHSQKGEDTLCTGLQPRVQSTLAEVPHYWILIP